MASSWVCFYLHGIVESHVTDPERSESPVSLAVKGLSWGLRRSRMKHNTLLQSPGGEWTPSDCCQTTFRTHGETFDITFWLFFWRRGFN